MGQCRLESAENLGQCRLQSAENLGSCLEWGADGSRRRGGRGWGKKMKKGMGMGKRGMGWDRLGWDEAGKEGKEGMGR